MYVKIGNKMKRYNTLRIVRIVVALLCVGLLTLTFVDWGNGTATVDGLRRVGAEVARWQFLPALMSVSALTLSLLLLLTLLFGRIYCSTLCPLGVVQDGVNAVRNYGSKSARVRFSFRTPKLWLRYGVLALTAICVATGVGFVVALVEPYSIFGRTIHEGLRPAAQAMNNVLALFFGDSFGREVISVSWLSAVVALITTLIILSLAWIGGRRYCNSFCPVGTLLGEVSRFSLFKVQIDTTKCIDCGLCGRKCKAECIDTVNHSIDPTRCVTCFDCIDACSQGAISFTMRSKTSSATEPADHSRRNFLTTIATVAAIPLAEAQRRQQHMDRAMQGGGISHGGNASAKHGAPRPVAPPGAQSLKNLQAKCTACHLCVSKCPSHALQPAVLEYGLQGIMQPVMRYDKGYCLYDCTLCGEVCPTGAILPLALEQKRMTQLGHAVFHRGRCVVARDGVECGNCAEHCPADAIKMQRGVDGRMYPQIEKALCIGCGACENLCPATPKAIEVKGYAVHK